MDTCSEAMADTLEKIKRNISANTSALNTQAQAAASTAAGTTITELDKRFPPDQRSEVSRSVKEWIAEHPRLFVRLPPNINRHNVMLMLISQQYFLVLHSFLTLPPLLFFLFAASTVFLTTVGSLVFIAISTACCISFFCISGMLLVLVPVLLFTVTMATGLFVAGSIGLWILRRFAESETPVPFAEEILKRVGTVQETITGHEETGTGKKELSEAAKNESVKWENKATTVDFGYSGPIFKNMADSSRQEDAAYHGHHGNMNRKKATPRPKHGMDRRASSHSPGKFNLVTNGGLGVNGTSTTAGKADLEQKAESNSPSRGNAST